MKFTVSRLCGGEALMAIPLDHFDIDMEKAPAILEEMGGEIKQRDGMMIVFTWKGMETTLYSQGKIMYFPLKDRQTCIKYSISLLEKLA
ncbi:MAG: hypothetical protein ACOX1N_00350 [Candidatus Methanomethylophilaceae archaeon]|jgi:hypothetical protein